jgi:ribosome-binding factor A
MSRIEQVNSTLQTEISKIVGVFESNKEGLVTITGVETSEDLKNATIWVSVIGADAEAKINELRKYSSKIRHQLHARIKMRYIPYLTFRWDKSGEQAARIEQLLHQIESDRSKLDQ